MFLKKFHIFIKKRAVLQQKFTVQVTTLADCDDITRFDGTVPPNLILFIQIMFSLFVSICLCTPHMACRQKEKKSWSNSTDYELLLNSVPGLWHFGTDLYPRIHSSD